MKKVIVLFVSIIGVISGCALRQVDSFYLDRAAMSEVDLHKSAKQAIALNKPPKTSSEFVITGHRIIDGSGTVIAYRAFSSGELFFVDQATFQKLTIFLPFSLSNDLTEVSLSEREDVIAYWSSGSSNFPGKTGCFGYVSNGRVRLSRITNTELSADLLITFDLVSPGGWKKECGRFVFNESMILKKRDVNALTPWEGTVGAHIYDESIR